MSIVDALVSVQAENIQVSLEKPENLSGLPEGSVIVDQVCQAWQAGENAVWYPAGFRGHWSPGGFGGPQFPVTVVHIPPRFVGDGVFDVDAVHGLDDVVEAVGDTDELIRRAEAWRVAERKPWEVLREALLILPVSGFSYVRGDIAGYADRLEREAADDSRREKRIETAALAVGHLDGWTYGVQPETVACALDEAGLLKDVDE